MHNQMILNIHELFEEFGKVSNSKKIVFTVYKESYSWLQSWIRGMHIRFRTAYSAQFKLREARKDYKEGSYSSKQSFRELEADSELLTLIGFYTNIHRAHLSVWIQNLLCLG